MNDRLSARVVNDTIYELCCRLRTRKKTRVPAYWVAEIPLLKELTTCLLSSQVKFEIAYAYADALHAKGILSALAEGTSLAVIQSRLRDVLKSMLLVRWLCGCSARVRYRFPHTRARAIIETARYLYAENDGLEGLLQTTTVSRELRALLVTRCVGVGPKQASMFLRNVGLGADLAVLDAHIMRYLNLYWGVDVRPHDVASLRGYERYEKTFLRIANYFDHSADLVDRAIWITMRAMRGRAHEHSCSGIGRLGLDTRRLLGETATNKAIPPLH